MNKAEDCVLIPWSMFASIVGPILTATHLSVTKHLEPVTDAQKKQFTQKHKDDPALLLWWQIRVEVHGEGLVVEYDQKKKKHSVLFKQDVLYLRKRMKLDTGKKGKMGNKSKVDGYEYDLVAQVPPNLRPKDVEVLGLTKLELEAVLEKRKEAAAARKAAGLKRALKEK